MSNGILKYSVLLWIQLLVLSTYAQTDPSNSEAIRDKQRVSYVYNFTKYIDWEGLDQRSEFVIGVLGKDEINLVNEFLLSAEKRTVKGLPVSVKSFTEVNEITRTDILFVNNSNGFDLNPILEKLYINHSLLVTEGYPFHMSMINFIELDDEFHFEINKAKINRAQLLVAPKLLSFSIQSTNDWNQLYNRLREEMVTVRVQKEELIKLSNEIETQKEELKIQEKELNKTIQNIEAQKKLLLNQRKNVEGQNLEIKKQIRQLSALLKKNNEEKAANLKLQTISKKQANAIADQYSQIKFQESTLGKQLEDIETQTEKIETQSSKLNFQLTKIEQQRTLLSVFIAFTLLAIFFSFFMINAYRRRKKNEVILKLKNEELVDVNKSLDSFTYRVAHDLKAPVINMKNMITLLKKFVDPSTQAVLPELYKNLDVSANRLDATIEGMLELTKIERMRENKEVCDLLELVNSLLPEYQTELNDIHATVDNSAMKQNAAFATKIEIISIFQNLITNSIKYRSKDRALSIVMKSEKINEFCLVTYSDNGLGIDLEKFEGKLFTIFERFTTDSTISGTGIGMHSIKKMVENNQGTIELKSKPDQGLTYLISFPIYRT